MKDLPGTEFDLYSFFEMTPDLVCVAGRDGYFKKINHAVISRLGYTEEELYAKPISEFIFPDDREKTQKHRVELLKGKVLHNFINRYLSRTNEIIWLEWTSLYFSEKELVFAVAKDITERKRVEEAVEEQYIRYKSLTTYFKSNLEKERKYLAYEMHEELAQLVAGLKMDVEWVSVMHPELDSRAKDRIEHALDISKTLIKTLQRMAFSISPNMLDEFGLHATLDWLCKEFAILNNIPCSFEGKYSEENFTQEIKIDFFRICQEALTNVIDHSNAENVSISLIESGENIKLKIVDDGRGFDMARQKLNPGLTSMRVRADSINGVLDIQTEPGHGTAITVTIAKNAPARL